jgi:hypothetical protein
MANIKPALGSIVTKNTKPLSEHGIVMKASQDTVTVRWHLKQDEQRGRAGTPVGTLFEDPSTLISDSPCPHCNIS